MSSSSKDKETGRKWESGASKRKRKAEIILSNQSMSSSMMKFLNKSNASSVLVTDNNESIVDIDLYERLLSEKITEGNEVLTNNVETKFNSEFLLSRDVHENLCVSFNLDEVCDLDLT